MGAGWVRALTQINRGSRWSAAAPSTSASLGLRRAVEGAPTGPISAGRTLSATDWRPPPPPGASASLLTKTIGSTRLSTILVTATIAELLVSTLSRGVTWRVTRSAVGYLRTPGAGTSRIGERCQGRAASRQRDGKTAKRVSAAVDPKRDADAAP